MESERLEYEIGETARFEIALLKNGRIFRGAAFKLAATFPDNSSPVSLTNEGQGEYSFEALLSEAGEMTLAVRALHPSSNAAEAIAAHVGALTAAIEAWESLPRNFATRLIVAGLRLVRAGFEARLADLLAPIACGSRTITVLDPPEDEDVEPPSFGDSVPPHGPSFAVTNDPYHPITVEVADSGSGVASVILYAGDDTAPHYMDWDGLIASHYPSEPWAEGLNVITIIAEDNAGNAAALVLEFMVDSTPPEFISFTPEVTSNPTPTVVIVVHDEHSGVVPELVRLYVNGSLCPGAFFSDDAIYYTLAEPLPPGLHQIGVNATDFAGNVAYGAFALRVLR